MISTIGLTIGLGIHQEGLSEEQFILVHAPFFFFPVFKNYTLYFFFCRANGNCCILFQHPPLFQHHHQHSVKNTPNCLLCLKKIFPFSCTYPLMCCINHSQREKQNKNIKYIYKQVSPTPHPQKIALVKVFWARQTMIVMEISVMLHTPLLTQEQNSQPQCRWISRFISLLTGLSPWKIFEKFTVALENK